MADDYYVMAKANQGMAKIFKDRGHILRIDKKTFFLWCFAFSGSRKAAADAIYNAGKNDSFFLVKWWLTISLQIKYVKFRAFFRKNKHKSLISVPGSGAKTVTGVFASAAKKEGVPVWFLEGAPLKDRLSIDLQGVNYRNSLPRTIDFYCKWAVDNKMINKKLWKDAADELEARPSRNNNKLRQNPIHSNIKQQNFIFFPMQDGKVTLYGGWAAKKKPLFAALKKAVKALPDGWHLRIKDHPSTKEDAVKELIGYDDRLVIDSETNSLDLIRYSQVTLTVNSSLGFQAMMLEKPVINIGQAFYGFADLTVYAQSEGELIRLFRSPEQVSFNAHSRSCFLNYIIATNFFPKVEEVSSGKWSMPNEVCC